MVMAGITINQIEIATNQLQKRTRRVAHNAPLFLLTIHLVILIDSLKKLIDSYQLFSFAEQTINKFSHKYYPDQIFQFLFQQ